MRRGRALRHRRSALGTQHVSNPPGASPRVARIHPSVPVAVGAAEVMTVEAKPRPDGEPNSLPPLEIYADDPLVQRMSGGDASNSQKRASAAPQIQSQIRLRGNGGSASQPTPLIRPLPPPGAYPVDALGPILAPAARAIMESVQVPDALAANSVLGAAALAAQSHANVQTLGGIRPVSLYLLTIAGSGDRKSTADAVALAPVRLHIRRLQIQYQAEYVEHQRAAEVYKFNRRRAGKNNVTPDEYSAALAEINNSPPPRRPWVICSEPTPEGLVRSLNDGQFAQGIFSDEGGTFLGGHGLSEESELRTIALLSRAWQGDTIDRVRAGDAEHVVLNGRRLSMHLLVQPAVANRLIGRELYRSQGFLARFLMAAPDSIAGTRRYSPGQQAIQKDRRIVSYYHSLTELISQPVEEDPDLGGLDLPYLTLSDDARQFLAEGYDEIEAAQGKGGALELLREWASKAAEHACRIAGVMTLVENPAASCISVEAMRNALTLAEHYLCEYERLVGCSGVSDEITRGQKLLEWIARKKMWQFTARDVMNKGPNCIRGADMARSAIATLLEHRWITTEDGRLYEVHPAALTEIRS